MRLNRLVYFSFSRTSYLLLFHTSCLLLFHTSCLSPVLHFPYFRSSSPTILPPSFILSSHCPNSSSIISPSSPSSSSLSHRLFIFSAYLSPLLISPSQYSLSSLFPVGVSRHRGHETCLRKHQEGAGGSQAILRQEEGRHEATGSC